MSVRFLIIDGYNLLHAAGLARSTYGPGDLARLRLQLLARIARRLTIEERQRCTVAFDAIDAPPQLPGKFKHEKMTVLFAEPGHEADEVIETLISQHSAPRRLTVVSSDHRLQTAVTRRRGTAIDSDVFLKQLDSHERQVGAASAARPTPSTSEKETGFWLEEFGAVSAKSIESEILAEDPRPQNQWDRHVKELQQQIRDGKGLDDWLNESPQAPPTGKPRRL